MAAGDQRPEDPPSKPPRRGIYAKETAGLLLIALMILVVTLLRYWHEIHWSLR